MSPSPPLRKVRAEISELLTVLMCELDVLAHSVVRVRQRSTRWNRPRLPFQPQLPAQHVLPGRVRFLEAGVLRLEHPQLPACLPLLPFNELYLTVEVPVRGPTNVDLLDDGHGPQLHLRLLRHDRRDGVRLRDRAEEAQERHGKCWGQAAAGTLSSTYVAPPFADVTILNSGNTFTKLAMTLSVANPASCTACFMFPTSESTECAFDAATL